MDIKVLNKRMHKLLIVSIMMVMAILLMAFIFINHADNSLNNATYTTMNQQVDLCKQRISSKKYTDLTLLRVLSKELTNNDDIDDVLVRMENENNFTSVLYVDTNDDMHVSSRDMHITYSDLSKDIRRKISQSFLEKK